MCKCGGAVVRPRHSFFSFGYLIWKRFTLVEKKRCSWWIDYSISNRHMLLIVVSNVNCNHSAAYQYSIMHWKCYVLSQYLFIEVQVGLITGHSKAAALMPRTSLVYQPSIAIPLVIIQLYLDVNQSRHCGKCFHFCTRCCWFISIDASSFVVVFFLLVRSEHIKLRLVRNQND